MKTSTLHRLHELRMANDAAGYAMDEIRPRFERICGRHENGTAPRAVSAYQLFQTPTALALRLVSSIGLAPGCRVLEPSAGLGRLLDAIALSSPREVVAVEISPTLAGELYRQERPRVTIKQRDFLSCQRDELGEFDAVVMNPPFHLRSDIKHINHALTFLRPGGWLAAICLNTVHRERALRDQAHTWEVIAAGAFGKEGTAVSTVMLTIHKSII